AKIPGTTEADQWVVRGNHHDAWVNGAEDPISGLVAELEEARALGEIYKEGWRPKRTIIYAAWDGEEPGLLGSTEWAETHDAELAAHGVAYLNSDTNDRGYLGIEGSHSLEHFINDVAKDVQDPESHVSSWRRNKAAGELQNDPNARTGDDLRIGALGSGSDFTPFLQHLGVASLNLGYGGEDDGGIYHSIYDDFYWYTHFSDTSFVYGRALSQAAGTAVMRLADADVLPFVFTNLAATTERYTQELEALRDRREKDIADRTHRLDDSAFVIANDPRRPLRPPAPESPPPHFDFAPLLNAQDSLSKAAQRFEKAYATWNKHPESGGETALHKVNDQLVQAERALLASDGLKNRPWYKHLLYAPGFYTGYGVKTMPGVREAIEQGKWSDVNGEISRVADALVREATVLNEAARLLSPDR
ncbi:MAG TPA: transferrin receptor-like dimerization domain-containing protein, partial [Gemmatimonadaceae bacterium]